MVCLPAFDVVWENLMFVPDGRIIYNKKNNWTIYICILVVLWSAITLKSLKVTSWTLKSQKHWDRGYSFKNCNFQKHLHMINFYAGVYDLSPGYRTCNRIFYYYNK